MGKWNFTLRFGKNLREAIEAEDVELVRKCLIACYRELLNKMDEENRDYYESDIEDTIFNLENFDEDEDVDDYLSEFYDICDDVRAWVGI